VKAAARRLGRIEAERARRRAVQSAPAREPVTRIETVFVDRPGHRRDPDELNPWPVPERG
jgi:hypothetical protein